MERKNNTELLGTVDRGKVFKPLEYFKRTYSHTVLSSAVFRGAFHVIPKALYSNLVYKEW